MEDRLLLVRLQVTEKAAEVSSMLFLWLGLMFMALLVFMIFSFVAGYYLSQAVGSYPGGFAILGAFYLLVMLLLVYLHKNYLSKKIADGVVKFSMKNKNADA